MLSQSTLDRIDRISSDFQISFGKLTQEQLNFKPNSKTWSIAQNIDHLITINQTYYPIFDGLVSGQYSAPIHGKLGFIVRFFGRFILQSVRPDRRQKIKTFPMWEPSNSEVNDVLKKLEVHHQELKQKIATIEPFLGKKTVIHSPASRKIVYTLDKALDIICTHEERHLVQANELKDKHLK
jgi:hypothetical protein